MAPSKHALTVTHIETEGVGRMTGTVVYWALAGFKRRGRQDSCVSALSEGDP